MAWLVALDLTTVGIENEAHQNSIKLFPNPVTDWLTISVPDSAIEQLQVFGIDGRLFYSNTTATQTTIQLDVSRWPVGMYFICVYAGNNLVGTEKVVVE